LQRDQEKKHINAKTELNLKMVVLQSQISKKDEEINTYRSETLKQSELMKESNDTKDKEHNELKNQLQKNIMDKLNSENEQTLNDILDDEQLINALMESKDTNAIITEKLKDLEKINEDIEKTREKRNLVQKYLI
jgi:hypothetical protein